MRRRSLGCAVLGCAALALFVVACDPPPSGPSTPITVPHIENAHVWALGDSQGSSSTDPARGNPWPARLPGWVANGAEAMQGAGWVIPGPHTSRTIPQQAAGIAATHDVTTFIVMAGVNDINTRTVAEMAAGVDQLAATAASEGARVVYVGIVPLPAGATLSNQNAKRVQFNALLAQRYGADYVDCSSTMATPAGWLLPGYSLAPDNLHLNSAGEQALADCIAPHL